MKKIVIATSLVLSSWLAASPVQAETTTRTMIKETRQTERAEVKAARQAWLGEKCDLVEGRIATIITRFDQNKARHVQQYQHMHDRIQTMLTQADAAGHDVTKLKEDLTIFDNRVKKFGSDYALWVEQLKLAQTHSCGESQGAFKEAMEKARQLGKAVQADVLELRNYYQNVIRPDITALKVSQKTAQ